MPISRELVRNAKENTRDRLYESAMIAVRANVQPLTKNGWINLIKQLLNIDREMSTGLIDRLLLNKILLYTRLVNKKPMYVSDTTPYRLRSMLGDRQE